MAPLPFRSAREPVASFSPFRATKLATAADIRQAQLHQLYRNHSAEDLLASLEVAVRIGRRDHQQVIQQLIDGGE